MSVALVTSSATASGTALIWGSGKWGDLWQAEIVTGLDSDGDGSPDVDDLDDDNDGVADESDAFPLNHAETTDNDGDGMGDNYENRFGLDPNDPVDAALDNDGDGASNLEEFERHRNPLVNEHAVTQGIHPIFF